MIILNGPILVDTFFIISGFLACYLLLEQIQKNPKAFQIPLFYVHRYVRYYHPILYYRDYPKSLLYVQKKIIRNVIDFMKHSILTFTEHCISIIIIILFYWPTSPSLRCRLTPVYAIVIAFYCTMFIKIGTGPLWNEKVGEEVERCHESWWANLLYINNYVKPQKLVSTNIYNMHEKKTCHCTPIVQWVVTKINNLRS